MKKNSGVSMITLVITIVMLIILASVTIYYGAMQNIDKTTETMSYNEIFEVSEAVAQRTLMNRLDSTRYGYIGEELDDSNPVEVNGKTYGTGWHKLDPKSNPDHVSDLSLENIKSEYVINYLTGEVISVNPIYFNDKEYYSSNEIKNLVTSGDTVASNSGYDAAKGVNKPVLVTGMVPVKFKDGAWVVTNADDVEWYDYSANVKAWANIMLMDDIIVDGYSNEDIRNASLAELEGRVVTTNGSMFVWIPRYSNNSVGEIVYSNLLTDYTDNGFSVSSSFTNGSSELTGIWISKFDAEFD